MVPPAKTTKAAAAYDDVGGRVSWRKKCPNIAAIPKNRTPGQSLETKLRALPVYIYIYSIYIYHDISLRAGWVNVFGYIYIYNIYIDIDIHVSILTHYSYLKHVT